MYSLIYTFHMPLFIFISGRFSHIREKEKYKQSIIRLLETFVVFQMIKAIPPLLVHDNITWKSLVGCFVCPRWTLWYLLSLVYWRIMVYAVPKTFYKNRPKTVLTVCFLVCLLGGFVPVSYPFSIQRTMAYLPFFFMGYYSTDIDVKRFVAQIPIAVSIAVLASSFLILYFVLNKNISFITNCSSSYWSVPTISPILRCLARGILLIVATTIGAMVMRLVPTKESLARWGSMTLVIYIYHSFIITALRAIISHGNLPHDIISLFVYANAITFGLIFIARFKFFTMLLNPVSNWMRRRGKERS